MKTEEEIKSEITKIKDLYNQAVGWQKDHFSGYLDALRWVLENNEVKK